MTRQQLATRIAIAALFTFAGLVNQVNAEKHSQVPQDQDLVIPGFGPDLQLSTDRNSP